MWRPAIALMDQGARQESDHLIVRLNLAINLSTKKATLNQAPRVLLQDARTRSTLYQMEVTVRGASIDCNTTCLQDCDCLGFDFRFDNQTGCRFWSVDCEFVEDLTQPGNASSLVLTKLMPTTKSPPPRKNGKSPLSTNRSFN